MLVIAKIMQRSGLQFGSRSAGRYGTVALVFALVGWSMTPQVRGYQGSTGVDRVLCFEPEEALSKGPIAPVTSLAFDPADAILYVAGFDKTVRVWKRDQATGQFVYQPESTGRVAIGKGLEGVINAMAVSPRGDWLAVGGQGFVRQNSQNETYGWSMPWEIYPDEYRKDRGQITVFRIEKRGEAVSLKPATAPLRAHRDSILALAVSGRTDGGPDVLASLSEKGSKGWVVNLWEIPGGIDDFRLLDEVAVDRKPPQKGRQKSPRIAVHSFGPEDIAVAVAIDGAPLSVWRRRADKEKGRWINPRPGDKLMEDREIRCLAWTGSKDLFTSSHDYPLRRVELFEDHLESTTLKGFRPGFGWLPISMAFCSPPIGAVHAAFITQKNKSDGGMHYQVFWGPIDNPKVIGEWSTPPSVSEPATLPVALNKSRLAFYSLIEGRITVCEPGRSAARWPLANALGIIRDAWITARGIYFKVKHKDGDKVFFLKSRTGTISDRVKPGDANAQDLCEIKEGNAVYRIKSIKANVLEVFDAGDRAGDRPICRIKPIEEEEHVLGVFAQDRLICCLVGHSGKIRTVHVTCSQDGKGFLTTTADDRTVNFWELPYLQENLQNRRIQNLFVVLQNDRYVIENLTGEWKNLKIQDRLRSIEFRGQPSIDLTKPRSFSEAIQGWEGEAIFVCERAGMHVEETVTIEPAAREFPPRATFVFLDTDRWVLWSQSGQYLAGRWMGKCIGLHSNSSQGDIPYGGTWRGLIDPDGVISKGSMETIIGLTGK